MTDAFAGRTVLVTGHTGFKGSWLSLWLSQLGAEVVGFARAPASVPNNFEAAGVREVLADHHEGDVRDGAQLSGVVEGCQPDVLFHLAAQSLVPEGLARPQETFEVNVLGTANVLEAVRQAARPCALVVVTSDKCYENADQPWGYREIDRLGGGDPYSASKAAAELVTAAYRHSFFAPERLSEHGVLVASARAGNVVGGGDWSADRLVPDAMRALSNGDVLRLRHPSHTRPWQHVLEPLSGYLMLAGRLLGGDAACCDAWNFGPTPGEEVTVRTLVEELFAEWGAGRWEALPTEGTVPEARRLRLAIDKAAAGLGWRPRWDRAEAVRRTVAWYRRYHGRDGDARNACLDDIGAYQQVAGRGTT